MVNLLGTTKDPRQKIIESPETLEDYELLSVVLGTGSKNQSVYRMSQDFLQSFRGLVPFFQLPPAVLMGLRGVGLAKAGRLLAMGELARRYADRLFQATHNPIVNWEELLSSPLPHSLYFRLQRETQESFFAIAFHRSSSLIGIERLARGSANSVCVSKRDLLAFLLPVQAHSVILAHNHPEGNCQPSEEDWKVFWESEAFLNQVEIHLLDQWILGPDGLYSCQKQGIVSLQFPPSPSFGSSFSL